MTDILEKANERKRQRMRERREKGGRGMEEFEHLLIHTSAHFLPPGGLLNHGLSRHGKRHAHRSEDGGREGEVLTAMKV